MHRQTVAQVWQDALVNEPAKQKARPAVRAAYLVLYGLFAALGAALLAPPALLAIRGLGLSHPVLAWDVPLGWLAATLLLLLSLLSLRFALAAALGGRARFLEHAAFLGLLSAALAVRGLPPPPAPPPDPTLALLAGLRAAADFADAQYARAQRYSLDQGELSAALGQLPPPGFRFRARMLPLQGRLAKSAKGPRLSPEPGDLPGVIYVAVSADWSRCWITALTLHQGQPAMLTTASGPLVLQARAGTHSAPGRDPLVPAYPSMRAVGGR